MAGPMDDGRWSDMAREKLAFFGAITASLSHELKNALATVNELTGLLRDLADAMSHGRPLSPERLHTVCGKIDRQIDRAEALIQRLNRFSHAPDTPRRSVDVRSILTDVCDLCDRFARLKQVDLRRRFPDETVSLSLDPFAFQHAVFLCIAAALDSAAEQRWVTVSYEVAGPRVSVIVESAEPIEPTTAGTGDVGLLGPLVHDLGGTLTLPAAGTGSRIAITFG